MNHPGKFMTFQWVSAITTSKDATGASFFCCHFASEVVSARGTRCIFCSLIKYKARQA